MDRRKGARPPPVRHHAPHCALLLCAASSSQPEALADSIEIEEAWREATVTKEAGR
jgi:hypothetical protein